MFGIEYNNYFASFNLIGKLTHSTSSSWLGHRKTQRDRKLALTLRNGCILNCFKAVNFLLTKSVDLSSLFYIFLFGEKEWLSDEGTRLPPVWPKFKSRCRRHLWVEFVFDSHFAPIREVFLRVLRFSPLLKNQHFQIPFRPGVR